MEPSVCLRSQAKLWLVEKQSHDDPEFKKYRYIIIIYSQLLVVTTTLNPSLTERCAIKKLLLQCLCNINRKTSAAEHKYWYKYWPTLALSSCEHHESQVHGPFFILYNDSTGLLNVTQPLAFSLSCFFPPTKNKACCFTIFAILCNHVSAVSQRVDPFMYLQDRKSN